MPRESKSAATIRRRRKRGPAVAQLVFRHKSVHGEDNLDSDEDEPDFQCEDPIAGPPVLRFILSSEWTLFLGLLAFRVVNALMIQTSYVPDEYWQSVEVAHNMAFGYGYLTWEWHEGLRGYSYPAMFAAVYKVLGLLRLDNRLLLIKLPRLMQAVMAALGDLYLYKWSRRLGGQGVAQWSLLCQLTSWFTFYCCTRTLTNSMETVLTTMALYYFPWPVGPRKAQWKYLSLVGLAVVVRPTAAILWIPLSLWHVWMYRHVAWRVVKLYAERGFIILSISSIIDRVFYGKWVNVQYNFLQFNVLANMGTFYGSHPWHWYLTQGFAVIMGTHIFPFILAVRRGRQGLIVGVIAWTVLVYSLLEHKEFRFIMPVLPLAMHVCGSYLHYVSDPHSTLDDKAEENDEENSEDTDPQDEQSQTNTQPQPPETPTSSKWDYFTRKRFLVMFLILSNWPLAMYTCLLHQRGTVDVMKFLHDESYQKKNESMSVLFLMPCHSTPYYSYVHRNISMRFLTCEPNLSHIPDYLDEADIFYQDPSSWLSTTFTDPSTTTTPPPPLPTHLVMFDGLQPQVGAFLETHNYRICATFFHSHVPEGRVGSHVIVRCKYTWMSYNRHQQYAQENMYQNKKSKSKRKKPL